MLSFRLNPRSGLVLLLVLGAWGCATTASRPSPYKPVSFRGAYEVYPSGLRLIVHEDPKATQATLGVSYRVGAVDEPVGKEGVALLAELLSSQARHGGPQARRLRSRVLAASARNEESLTYDETHFQLTAPVAQFARLVGLEAQRMREPLAHVTEADFLEVRDGVMRTLPWAPLGLPSEEELDWLRGVLPDSPYLRPLRGTRESLQRLTLEDVRAFVKQHYTPAHAVVVVTGPLSLADAKFEVARGFSSLTGTGSATRTPPVQQVLPPLPPLEAWKPLVTRGAPVLLPQLLMVWRGPGLSSGKRFEPEFLAAVLKSAVTLRYGHEPGPIASEVFVQETQGMSLIVLRAHLAKKEDALTVLDNVKWSLGNVLASSRLRDEARETLLASKALSLYKALERLPTQDVARQLRATGQAHYVSAWQQQSLQAVEGLREYAGEVLQDQYLQALLLVPEWHGAKLLGAGAQPFSELLSSLQRRALGELPAEARDVREEPSPPGLDAAERFTLSNGLKVVALWRGSAPLVEARLLFPLAPVQVGDTTSVAARAVLQAGSDTTWPRGGGHLSEEVGEDFFVVRASAVSANLQPMVQFLSVYASATMQGGLDFEARRDAGRFLARADDLMASERAERVLAARLFPGHSHGAFASPEKLEALTREQFMKWTRGWCRPENATLLLVGELPPGPELKTRLEALLGRWRGEGASAVSQEPAREPAWPGARGVVLVDAPGSPSASISLGLRWPVLEPAQEAAAEVLTSWLWERLPRQLREEPGSEGAVRVLYRPRPQATPLLVQANVKPQAVASVLEQTLAELAMLEDELPPSEEVERARWWSAREFSTRFQTDASVVAWLEVLARWSLAPEHWEQYPERLASVTSAELQALVKRLNLGSEVIVITGDAALLQPQLEKAGYRVEREVRKAPTP